MVILVTGGSGSGKSAYAEEIAIDLGKGKQLYYLATMKVYDEEGIEKINRHRRLRAGKGFETIEQPTRVGKAISHMKSQNTVLLECMSNLVANEMFQEQSPEDVRQEESLETRIMKDIYELTQGTDHLIIVTNNVFEDGICYDASTMEYIRVLALINQEIGTFADQVVEVVAGIPVIIKNGE